MENAFGARARSVQLGVIALKKKMKKLGNLNKRENPWAQTL